MNYDPVAFGKLVLAKRNRLQMTLKDVSNLLSVGACTINRIEHGGGCDVKAYLALTKWIRKPVARLPEVCANCDGKGVVW